MGKIIRNGIEYSGTYDDANSVNYDNSLSGLEARTVQEGIDNLSESLGGYKLTTVNGKIAYYKESEGADSAVPFSSGEVTKVTPTSISSSTASGIRTSTFNVEAGRTLWEDMFPVFTGGTMRGLTSSGTGNVTYSYSNDVLTITANANCFSSITCDVYYIG